MEFLSRRQAATVRTIYRCLALCYPLYGLIQAKGLGTKTLLRVSDADWHSPIANIFVAYWRLAIADLRSSCVAIPAFLQVQAKVARGSLSILSVGPTGRPPVVFD